MFSKAPFAGFVMIYIAGIAAGRNLPAPVLPLWVWASISILPALAALLFYKKGRVITSATMISLFFLLTGAGSIICVDQARERSLAALSPEHEASIIEIRSLPEKRANFWRFEAALKQVLQEREWISLPAKVLVNVPAGSGEPPKPGELLLIKGRLKQPTVAENRFQFDYRAYLRNKGILWTTQLWPGTFTVLPNAGGSPDIYTFSQNVSAEADSIFSRNIADSASYGLVKAMVLGRRDDLNPDQVNHYIASGAVHILSVSGMHVAIVFLIVSTALGWIKRLRFGRWLYLVVVLLVLGFYAVVTGLSPSVQRSALMCAIFVIAEVFNRKHNSMNTLAISALVILLVDPCALFDVGFQLSYLAMSGIFLFYPVINAWVSPGNKVATFVWQITALSFAAQVATFPLSVYYFHQFPTYFWLVNPFVIAFTNVLLPAAMVLLLVDFTALEWLQSLAGFVVEWSAKLANYSVQVPEHLPAFLIENLHLNIAELLLLYIVMIAGWLAYETRSFVFLKITTLTVLIFVFVSVSGSLQAYYPAEMQPFHIRGHRVIGFKEGNALYIAADHAFRDDRRSFDFFVKPYIVNREIDEIIWIGKPSKPVPH